MSIFNSLGSNYTFSSGWRILFSYGGRNAEQKLTEYLEAHYGGRAILTYKGREALALAVKALPKGAVAINGFTCLAVYEAITESGRAIHYIDIPENALNFTPESLQNALTSNPTIRAVVVQNTLGIPCDIRAIAGLCKERGIILIEDLAHSIGTRYESGEEAGTVGDFVVLSFSQDKVVDSVSGGALIIRNEEYKTIAAPTKKISFGQQLKDRFYPRLTWKIRAFYPLGIGRPLHRLYRGLRILSTPFGESSTSAHKLAGWYCANILQQYKALEKTSSHRREIAKVYAELVDKRLLLHFDVQRSSNLRFPILVQNREGLIAYLKTRGVYISDIWYDAPIAPKKFLAKTNYRGQCPQAENVSERIVNLPTHINVSTSQAREIAEAVNRWLQTEGSSEYRIANITDENVWEGFLQKLRPHSFLHSWKWGQHYELSGSKIFRVGVYRAEALAAVALLIKIEARRGSFLLCPHGPLFAKGENEKQLLELITNECVRFAKSEHCDFIRFCPLSKPSRENIMIYHNLGFRGAPIHMHPELSWMLDITKPEDELLREMRKTTRYLIKRMEKEAVEITQSSNPADMELFWPIYEATVERQQFTPFSKAYLQKEFELFAKEDQAAFFFGRYQGKIIAAAIIIFYNGSAFYHHSGSTSLTTGGSNASYLLQWRVIQEAKRRGCTLYNFWGISPDNRPKHPWAGLSLFKKGFGGFSEEYLHAQDKPLTTKYAINYAIETARRIRRGL